VFDAGGRDEEEIERLLRLLEDVLSKVRELAERDTRLGAPSSVYQSSSLSLILLPGIPIVMFMLVNTVHTGNERQKRKVHVIHI
jgi:hypothetical protein